MSQETTMCLNTSCIKNVPFNIHYQDFSFFVNGDEFRTSPLVAELLSPSICKIRRVDPHIKTFTINTLHRGDFRYIFELLDFRPINIPSDELPFLIEVMESLDSNCIELEGTKNLTEITVNNALGLLLHHEKSPNFYSRQISEDIDFISSHFYELCEGNDDEFAKLSPDTLMQILGLKCLKLSSDDDLLKFANRLYKINRDLAFIYEYVNFEKVSADLMNQFNETFDKDDMTHDISLALSKRKELDTQ